MHGVGKFIWSNGKSYEGDFKMNMMNGDGRYVWPDGKVYIGEFEKDQRKGYGVLRYFVFL